MPLPTLVEDLLNPALLALLLREAADGYRSEHTSAMAWPLAFVAAPMVLHGPTRDALPRTVATHLSTWAGAHHLLVAGLPARARSLATPVRAGLRLGLRHALLEIDNAGGLLPGRVRPGAPAGTLLQLHQSARLVGRWLGRSNEPSTVFALLRVVP